jgi:hypothetical protein
MGRVLIITGNTAQCIAHAAEVAIPIKSQLILIAINVFQLKNKNSKFATLMQDYSSPVISSCIILLYKADI